VTVNVVPLQNSRKHSDWISSYLDYTSLIISPEIFRRWTAYSTISSALERRVWTVMSGHKLHPNMLILFVADPGVGKTMAVEGSRKMLARAGGFNLSPNAMTKAAMVDHLAATVQTAKIGDKTIVYHFLVTICTEFGTLLPDYDLTFLNTINEWFDCLDIYEDRTRKVAPGQPSGLIKIDRPGISILSGTQPMYLSTILPDAAYGMGFTSRIIMVHSSEEVPNELFKGEDNIDNFDAESNPKLRDELVYDIKIISKLSGQFRWRKESQLILQDVYNKRYFDGPTHPRLLHYCKRRHLYAAKLAMAISVSKGDDLIVEEQHITEARRVLLEAEKTMPDIFRAMNVSQDSIEIAETHRFIIEYCTDKEVTSIPEHRLVHFIMKRVAVQRVGYIIDIMIQSQLIQVVGVNLGKGSRNFKAMDFSAEKGLIRDPNV